MWYLLSFHYSLADERNLRRAKSAGHSTEVPHSSFFHVKNSISELCTAAATYIQRLKALWTNFPKVSSENCDIYLADKNQHDSLKARTNFQSTLHLYTRNFIIKKITFHLTLYDFKTQATANTFDTRRVFRRVRECEEERNLISRALRLSRFSAAARPDKIRRRALRAKARSQAAARCFEKIISSFDAT